MKVTELTIRAGSGAGSVSHRYESVPKM